MLTHPHEDLDVLDRRGRELRAEADAERARGVSGTRHAVADVLRWTADRLEPPRLAPAPRLVKER
jgi:hypothetical protein